MDIVKNKLIVPYSEDMIKTIIDEYRVMKHQFLTITDEQICEHIKEMLIENVFDNKN